MKRLYLFFIILVCSACGANTGNEINIELTAFATEASMLRQDAQLERTAIVSTIEAAQQLEQAYLNYNNILVVTVRADQIPTPVRMVPVPSGNVNAVDLVDTSDGVSRFLQIGFTGFINPETQCAEEQTFVYELTQTSTVFMTTRATNLQVGTNLQVDWFYEGEPVHQSFLTTTEFSRVRCLAFALTSDVTFFQAGEWSATLYVNTTAIDTITFNIEDTMTDNP